MQALLNLKRKVGLREGLIVIAALAIFIFLFGYLIGEKGGAIGVLSIVALLILPGMATVLLGNWWAKKAKESPVFKRIGPLLVLFVIFITFIIAVILITT